jgi:hypothetical protein
MGYAKKGKKDQQNGKEGVQILRMMPTNVAHIFVLVGVCSSGGERFWSLKYLDNIGISQGSSTSRCQLSSSPKSSNLRI